MRCFESPQPKVGVIGAGRVGSTLAQRLAEKNIADVVLLDIVPGLPQGIALDLMEARGIERHDRQITGSNDYGALKGVDVVVITAGKPRSPGMSRDDLLLTNARIVGQAARLAVQQSPEAIFVVVTNPLDVMTYLTWQESGLPPERVLGMAGVLDSARFQTFIAMELGVSIADVTAMVLGSHGDAMLPLPRYCTVNGISITDLLPQDQIDQLVRRTQQGGAEIVELVKTGSAFYAPSSSACLMVESILMDRHRLLPTSCYLQGEYGLSDVYLGVPAQLGRSGREKIMELSLTPSEQEQLRRSADAMKAQIETVRQGLKQA
ncbi:MAG: malate dehydrogenase [Prochlorotrichaceae cyanobacterium]